MEHNKLQSFTDITLAMLLPADQFSNYSALKRVYFDDCVNCLDFWINRLFILLCFQVCYGRLWKTRIRFLLHGGVDNYICWIWCSNASYCYKHCLHHCEEDQSQKDNNNGWNDKLKIYLLMIPMTSALKEFHRLYCSLDQMILIFVQLIQCAGCRHLVAEKCLPF